MGIDLAALRERAVSAVTASLALQQGRLFLWLPVAFGAGAALYLALRFEPSWWVLAPPTGALAFVAILMRRINQPTYLIKITMVLALVCAGAAVTKLRAEHVAAPVLSSARSQYRIEAYVVDIVSSTKEEPRVLLAPMKLSGLPADQVPLRLRLSMRPEVFEAAELKPGDAVSAFAILNPPPSPAIPGGYDFARMAWFQGIGGVGLIPASLRHIKAPPAPWRLQWQMQLNRLRWKLTNQLVADISPEFDDGPAIGGFASALVTGHQAFVPKDLVQVLRNSGLAHILSISGVHMATVALLAFFGLRLLLAAMPPIALRFPIKKIAAAFAVVCVLLYLAISGAPAPAVRAAVVACVAFGAILCDRKALSLRALALAAFIVLGLTPEAVIQPGFQMSFSATVALLAFSEAAVPQLREVSVPGWVKAVQSAFEGLKLSILASLVATGATTQFSIAYFNRFTVYGVASNLFEAPISTFVVMPSLAIAAAGTGTPVGWLAARVAGGGLWLISKVAELTADLPLAVVAWPSAPSWVLVVAFLGILWACLLRGHVRWLGIVVASAILWWPRIPPSDIWIDPQGANAAIRLGQQAFVMRPRVRQFGFEQWTQRYGLTPDDAAREANFICKSYGCVPRPSAKYRVSFWFSNKPPKPELLDAMCRAGDLVVLRSPAPEWPTACAGANHLTAADFRRLGALELSRQGQAWTIKASQPMRGKRFWSGQSEAEPDVSGSGESN